VPLPDQRTVSLGAMSGVLRAPWLTESEDHMEILPPVVHEDKMLFQGFCNGLPIAFARLRRLPPEDEISAPVVRLLSAVNLSTWSLQTIQVSQNYRNRGIGTALLKEILHYCRYHHVARLVGEVKGELPQLQRWYARNGFQVTADNRIELLVS
jgi:GNAT superfamily N-acetyltransferase